MMKIPTTLKHKPVIVAEGYGNIDGRYAYKTDVQGLSLGLAQWNDRGKLDISAKIWRYTGEKWSRTVRGNAAAPRTGSGNLSLRGGEIFQRSLSVRKAL